MMMKILSFFLMLIFTSVSAQSEILFRPLATGETDDFFADDYGNFYLYKKSDFSFTKYDSLGNQQGRLMTAQPFKIQSVQNPLSIVMFSENAQQIKFMDQNLNEIQQLDLQNFGFIKMAYAEDLQMIWLLDESSKRLLQYSFRENRMLNAFPFFISFSDVVDMMVHNGRLFLLRKNDFSVYDFNANLLFSAPVSEGKRLRRENQEVFVISHNSISKFAFPKSFDIVFSAEKSQIVDKNSGSYFELSNGKLYLYPLGNQAE